VVDIDLLKLATFLLYLNGMWGCTFVEGPLAYWAAEFYPTHLRARGQTLTVVSFGVFSILWGQSTPTAISKIGWKLFLIIISVSLVNSALLYFYFPDTHGKTLEEIALVFGNDGIVVVRQEDIHIDADHRITAMVHDKEAEHEVVETFEDFNVSTKETI
jgi:hypothetical protein